MARCASSSLALPMRFALSIYRRGQLVYALRTATGYQLMVAGKASPLMAAPIAADAGSTVLPISFSQPVRFPRMC